MKITPLQFLFVASLFIFALPVFAQSSPAPQIALVGTYTTKTQSKGIYTLDFDSASGKISPARLAAETPDPSFVAIHPSGKFVYAVNEAGKASAITSFALDATTGKLTQLNQLSSQGEDPCYLSFDKTGKFLFVANYTSGTVAIFPILADGRLGPSTSVVQHHGAGPNKERQEAPHAHWIESSADNRFVFVSDLGLDQILIYRFDPAKGTLQPSDPPFVKLAPAAGPRHVAFHPNGKFVFVLSEIDSTVTAFSYDSGKASFQQLQAISTLPKGFQGRNDTAEIAVHPSGKWLFASNRGEDSIAVFSVDPQTGALKRTGDYPTGGKEPRHFTLDPSGNFLLAENQNSDSIVELRFDPASGALTATGQSIAVPAPVCLVFLPTH
jgi:6-phosphogluconolactonase